MNRPVTAAFFDVDQTLLRPGTALRFLRFHLNATGRAHESPTLEADLLRRGAVDRESAIRHYFRSFAGRPVTEVAEQGWQWFTAELAAGNLFHPETLPRFDQHLEYGHFMVLVSAAFPPCLDPIAEYLQADAVICSRPAVHAGRYTGAVEPPMGPRQKAAAVRVLAGARRINLAESFSYGEYLADRSVRSLVGHPA